MTMPRDVVFVLKRRGPSTKPQRTSVEGLWDADACPHLER